MTVHEAWSAVMDEVQAVSKKERNTQQNFNFRGIDAVVNAVGPALRKHKVIVIPERIVELAYRDVTVGKNETPMRECTIRTQWRAIGPEGDSFTFETAGEALDSGDKGTAKAQSVAQRISLLQALCIPTDDTDPDSHSYERSGPIAVRDPGRTRGKTQRTKPDGPTDDPWTAPAERATDVAWFADIQARLDRCGTAGEVKGLIDEARAVWTEGRLSDADATLWKDSSSARLSELLP